MYHRKLRVGLFGIDAAVSDAFRSVDVPEQFEVTLVEYAQTDTMLFGECEFAVVSDPSLCVADRTSSISSALPRFVLYASASVAQSLDARTLALFEDVWIASSNAQLAALRFRKLLEREKLAADLFLECQYLDAAIDSIPELVWYKDAKGAHLKVNDAFCRTVEKTKAQVEGRGHYYIWNITPDEYAQGEFVCMESEEETMQAGKTCLFDELVKTKNGMRQFKTYKTPLFDFDGSVVGTVGIAHDVTSLHNIEAELSILINAMPFAVIVLNNDGTVLNLNGKTEEYFCVARDQVLGGSFDQWRRRVLSDAVVEANDFTDSSFFTATIEGVEKTFEIKQQCIKDVFGNTTGDLRIYRDVTKERELERSVVKSANTDYLTGLYNRRYLYEYLGTGKSNRTTLLYLDLDDFKGINDRFGHQAGDTVLIETSALLMQVFPRDIVVRMGGDEFIVAITDERAPVIVEEQARVFLAALKSHFETAESPWGITGSIGIAATDDANLSIDALIKQSDAALYAAKYAGKSQFCVQTNKV